MGGATILRVGITASEAIRQFLRLYPTYTILGVQYSYKEKRERERERESLSDSVAAMSYRLVALVHL